VQFWASLYTIAVPSNGCLSSVRSILSCPSKIAIARRVPKRNRLLDSSRFGSSGRLTRESDCYALGMVIYEVSCLPSSLWSLINSSQVLTGLRPFHHLHTCFPVLAIVRGERPGKPLNADSLGFSDKLWELVQSCWSESSSARPTTQRVFDSLSHASRTWVPPPVYPAIGVDIDSDSSGSLNDPDELNDQGIGTGDSTADSVVPIAVLLLFLVYLSRTLL